MDVAGTSDANDLAASGAIPFGRYRLTERLGRGGMAVAYRAVMDGPLGFSRPLVIKRIRPELSHDPAFVRMLITEARITARLLHPGIVQVHELGKVSDEYYLAMELVDGYALSTIMRHCARLGVQIPSRVCCYIAREVACALAYAHELRAEEGEPLAIVHRDVSPSNIMITRQGSVKLLDFGIAKAASCIRTEQTNAGTLKGKPSYMSPEQASGKTVDARSDIFALGIVLHECLTMRPMFRGGDDIETLRQVRAAEIAPPSSYVPAIRGDIDAVVMGMLARDPMARYASCEAVAADLGAIVHRLQGDATSVRAFLESLGEIGSTERAPDAELEQTPAVHSQITPVDASPPTHGATAIASRTPLDHDGRSRRVAFIVAISIIVSATVALWLPLGRGDGPAAPTAAAHAQGAPTAAAPLPVRRPLAAGVSASPDPADQRVRLIVTGPRGATVSLDGVDVGEVPFESERAMQRDRRSLVIRAPGHQPYRCSIAGDTDTRIAVELTRLSPSKPAGPRTTTQRELPKDPFAGEVR